MSASRGGFALLRVDGVGVAVPLGDVQALEPIFDVRFGDNAALGLIESDEDVLDVFVVDRNFQPSDVATCGARICAVLTTGTLRFGFACQAVSTLTGVASTWSLAKIMRGPDSPVSNLVVHAEEVLCLSDAKALYRYLQSTGAASRDAA